MYIYVYVYTYPICIPYVSHGLCWYMSCHFRCFFEFPPTSSSCHASATAAETRFTGGDDGLRDLKWGMPCLVPLRKLV